MATQAKWVFDKAIYLMDEQSESTGQTQTADTKEYEYRSVPILNVLRHELYPISDNYKTRDDGKRSVSAEIQSLDDYIDLDDVVAQGIMPYGLAAHLLLGENDTMANYFSQRYSEMYASALRSLPSQWEDIPMHYGGLSI